MIELILIAFILISLTYMIYMVRKNRIKDLDKYVEDTYIISDHGDEMEHIWSKPEKEK